MKITITGTGYVGLVTGTCLAELGNDVLCFDIDADKIAQLQHGIVPIYEPGLAEIIERNRHAGRLAFSSDIAGAARHGMFQFIAVGTPPDEDGSADMRHVLAAARGIGLHMDDFKIVVNKSTMPIGAADNVHAAIAAGLADRGADIPFTVVSNPEFLKEGAAVEDFMRPDRIVIGCGDDEHGLLARRLLEQLYAPLNRNSKRTLVMDIRSAEFTKYAANAMLATRISFINELANLADRVGADIEQVRRGIGSDTRIGYDFLYAGCGYGCSCFPKDVQALIHIARGYGTELNVLAATELANYRQKSVLAGKIHRHFGASLAGRHFAVWGLAFKPNTNDVRAATSLQLIADLLAGGACVSVYDPVALDEARRRLAAELDPAGYGRIRFCEAREDTLANADALVILTEWKEFRSPDFQRIRASLNEAVIFDGRNLYDPVAMRSNGWTYYTIGRDATCTTIVS